VNSKVDAEFAALDVELGMLPATWEDKEGAVSWDLDKEAGLWMRFAGCELKDMILTPVERG
jgi:hypothetical protein